MPWSFEKRFDSGSVWPRVFRRSGLLLVWGLIARSIRAGRPVLDVINVLGQLAFTYPAGAAVLRRGFALQAGVALALLAVHTAAFAIHGDPWTVGANLGEAIDRAVFGKNWGGHYATVNCVSSAANTIIGVMAGTMLRAGQLRRLAQLGIVLTAAGLALSPWIPIIKKIWTASFALTSAGISIGFLLLFWYLCEHRGFRFPLLTAVGANSIFIYLFHEILEQWLTQTAKVFTGWGTPYWPDTLLAFNDLVVVAFQIWVCAWLYRRNIFFKL
jgi:predicted acyltransferase